MPKWSRYALAATFLVYFPLAFWLKTSFVDLRPRGKIVVQLQRPFEKLGAFGAISRYWHPAAKLEDADSAENEEQSTVQLYEDGHPLGPAHSNHTEVAQIGEGRYSHWAGQTIVFSASDNTDPNTNGRRYWAVVP
jgi:hypothetical protein